MFASRARVAKSGPSDVWRSGGRLGRVESPSRNGGLVRNCPARSVGWGSVTYMMNAPLIDSCIFVPELVAGTKEDALAEILDAMVAGGTVVQKHRDAMLAQLHEREAQGSTGLGNRVAVPHVKETDVESIRMAVAISSAGIPFDAIDGRPVQILFMVLGYVGAAPEEHLQVLRWVSGLARNADFRRFAVSAGSADALRDLLIEMSETA